MHKIKEILWTVSEKKSGQTDEQTSEGMENERTNGCVGSTSEVGGSNKKLNNWPKSEIWVDLNQICPDRFLAEDQVSSQTAMNLYETKIILPHLAHWIWNEYPTLKRSHELTPPPTIDISFIITEVTREIISDILTNRINSDFIILQDKDFTHISTYFPGNNSVEHMWGESDKFASLSPTTEGIWGTYRWGQQ